MTEKTCSSCHNVFESRDHRGQCRPCINETERKRYRRQQDEPGRERACTGCRILFPAIGNRSKCKPCHRESERGRYSPKGRLNDYTDAFVDRVVVLYASVGKQTMRELGITEHKMRKALELARNRGITVRPPVRRTALARTKAMGLIYVRKTEAGNLAGVAVKRNEKHVDGIMDSAGLMHILSLGRKPTQMHRGNGRMEQHEAA